MFLIWLWQLMILKIFFYFLFILLLQASLSMKFFGNEVKYMVIAGKDDLNSAVENFNPLTIIKNFLSGQVRPVIIL